MGKDKPAATSEKKEEVVSCVFFKKSEQKIETTEK